MNENQSCSPLELAKDAFEYEDHVKIILPSNYNKYSARIPHGIVISGEASESDEEIDTHQTLPQSGSNVSISETGGQSPMEQDKDSSVQHSSLLHKKLREKNVMLRKNVVELVTQPYESASKEIHTISQQLIKSQLLVQDLRNTMRRLANDLLEMEDKMEALKTASLLPSGNWFDSPTTEEPYFCS